MSFSHGRTGKALVAGAYDVEVLNRLRWFRDSFGPLLDMAIRALGGIDLRELMAEALMRGDELHNRNRAATSLFINQIALGLLDIDAPVAEKKRALLFLNGNGQFFVSAVLPATQLMLTGGAPDPWLLSSHLDRRQWS